MTPIAPFRRAFTIGALALATLASGCASLAPASAVPTAWTGVTHGVSLDPTTGKFRREGVALFRDGEAALMTMEGQLTARDGSTMTVTNTYRFEDGSGFVHEGTGVAKTENGRRTTLGTGRFTSGTGRFAGISGTTSSTSRTLSQVEQVTEFKAEATLAGK